MAELVQYGLYLVGVLVGVGLIMAGARNVLAGIAVVCLIVFLSAIAPQAEAGVELHRTWLQPLQEGRAELYLGVSCVLLAIVATNMRYVRTNRIPMVTGLMLLINVFAGVLDTRDDPADGAMRIGLAIISIGSLSLFVPAMLRTWDDYLPLLRALGIVGVLWVGGSLVQAVLDQSQLLMGWHKRFAGLSGNPQGAAIYLGPQSAIILWLMLNDTARSMRILWACIYAITLMMVVWTGSRTGGMLAMVGAMFLLRARLGRAVFLLPVLAAALVGVAYLVSAVGIELPIERIMSSEDTRSAAWTGLLSDALHTGVFGEGRGGARFVENSYLLGWVVYGPIMLALLLFQLVAMGVHGLKLWSVRHDVPPKSKSIIDLIIGYYVMFFLGAQFEWFVLARIDANISLVVVFSCVGASMLATVREQRLAHGDDATYDANLAIEYGEDARQGA